MNPAKPLLLLTLSALVPGACAQSKGPAPAPKPPAPIHAVNLLKNPGFEDGRDPWTKMGTDNWGAFEVTAPGHSGASSARLRILAAAGERQPTSRVFGVVQEIPLAQMPGGFPETLSGWYRVDGWNPPGPPTFLYLQAVVIAWGDPRTSRLVGGGDIQNYQVRFMLAGSPTQPFQMSNAHYEFISREQPKVGEWVHFEIPVRQKFLDSWGVVPDDFQFLRVLFEGRWDARPATAAVDATVLYDDLFFGYGSPPAEPTPKH